MNRCLETSKTSPPPAECAVLDDSIEGTPYSRAEKRVLAKLQYMCLFDLENPARANFPDGDALLIVPQVKAILEESARDTVATVSAVGQSGAEGSKRCARAVSTQSSNVTLATLEKSTRCQNRLDSKAGPLGPLAASCTAPAERAVRRADAAIQRRCTDAVGEGLPASTCAPFPACQTEFDVTTGQRLAATAYQVEGEIEEPTKCGDGIIDSDQSEICDDGNTVPSDACTDTCKPAVCSDGIVWEGMEICDDVNSVDDDCCSNDCQTAARCGDGVAQPGCGEECDDPNDPGCRDCRFVPFACDGSGLVATIAVRYDLSTSIPGDGLGGAKVRIDYPAALGIATLEGTPLVDPSRLRNVGDSRASLFARTGDENSDAAPDITLLYALPGRPGFAAGDIVDVQFDCAAGTSVVTRDLTCAVLEASDVFGNAIFSTPELTSQSIPCQVTQTRLASAVSP